MFSLFKYIEKGEKIGSYFLVDFRDVVNHEIPLYLRDFNSESEYDAFRFVDFFTNIYRFYEKKPFVKTGLLRMHYESMRCFFYYCSECLTKICHEKHGKPDAFNVFPLRLGANFTLRKKLIFKDVAKDIFTQKLDLKFSKKEEEFFMRTLNV